MTAYAAGAAGVLVVGGGPAGSSLALRLARRGMDVRLLDARDFPRSKPCGDCLSPGATPLLEELRVADAVRRGGAARLRGWRVRSPGGRWFQAPFGEGGDRRGPSRGLALGRRDLDAILLEAAEAAGTTVLTGRRVFDVRWRDGRVHGVRARAGSRIEEHRADFVVGADGLRSAVARRLGGVRRGRRERLALVGRLRDVPDDLPPWGEMRLGSEGCLGFAPTGGGTANLSLVVPAARARRISGDVTGFFRRGVRGHGAGHLLAGGTLAGPVEVTGPFEVAPRRLSRPGALLVGDAAGYLDPLTGQGVYRALLTARLAAAALVACTSCTSRGEAGEAAAMRRYEGELARHVEPARRLQRLIDAVVTRPGAMDVVAGLLRARPGLASLLFDVTGDRLPPGALLDPRRPVGGLRGGGAGRTSPRRGATRSTGSPGARAEGPALARPGRREGGSERILTGSERAHT